MPERILAYTDKLSVEPGELVEVKVSSPRTGSYRAALVRVICGDDSPDGPGYKVEPVAGVPAPNMPARNQPIPCGSYVEIDDRNGFALAELLDPRPPSGRPGSTRAASSASSAIGMRRPRPAMRSISMRTGRLALRIGDQAPLVLAQNLMSRHWYMVAVAFDAKSGRAVLASRRRIAYGHSEQTPVRRGQARAVRERQPLPDRGLEQRPRTSPRISTARSIRRPSTARR